MISDPAHALAEALKLAEQGMPVFPARLCADACLKCPGCKSPFPGSHGFKDASADPREVQRLWRRYPGQLIGVPTGEASGFDVLDIDSAKHNEALCWWMSHRSLIPPTRVHQSGSGGLHVLFLHHPLARQGGERFGPGVDVRAAGGYIIWWPAAGRKILRDDPINYWPQLLLIKQQPKPEPVFRGNGGTAHGPRKLEGITNFVASLREGQRNNGAFWGFCRAYEAAAEGTVGESEAISGITEAALRTGLSLAEIRKIARSARNIKWSARHVR